MDKITLLEQTLDHKLEKYEGEEFDEAYVEKKVYLKRLEEVDKVQEELVGEIDGFLREFPTSEMTVNYKSLKLKAYKIVEEFWQVLREGVSKAKRAEEADLEKPSRMMISHADTQYWVKIPKQQVILE